MGYGVTAVTLPLGMVSIPNAYEPERDELRCYPGYGRMRSWMSDRFGSGDYVGYRPSGNYGGFGSDAYYGGYRYG